MSDLFVPPERLAEDEEAVVVDVRDPREYEEGHVPGAVNVPYREFRDPTDETPGKLPAAEAFGDLLGNAGIAPGDRVVAYDGEFGVYASRFLVTAEVFGHDIERLGLLDGDFADWRDRTETTTDSPAVEPTGYEAELGDGGPLIAPEALEAALGSAVVVDTRDPVEYDTVHLPGAVNLQWRDLVDEDERRLKPDPRLREVLGDHGVAFDRPVRLYCNTARRLSFVYAVLRALGHDDVAVYEGGIDAWAGYGGPVETT
ncbi:sulfurtransferase [Halosimplex halophilum]|uniref:sulfurtransferase n=1 Tax=Halosimplex halophilum TaxID=2559572 RepID=UPI00107EEAEF|nr:rhodanese-like domain-containing protein [Halosimplex halophilum]